MYKFKLRKSKQSIFGVGKLLIMMVLLAMCMPLRAQVNPTIRLANRSTTVSAAFVEISKQTGLGITHDQDFNTTRQITLPKGTLPLSEVMAVIMAGTPMEYMVYNGVVIVRKARAVSSESKQTELKSVERIRAIRQTIEGRVSEIGSSMPLENVEVVLIGQTRASVKTDAAGYFRLEGIPIGHYTIRLSHSSYGSIQYQLPITEGRNESVLIALTPKQTVIVPYETAVPGLSENNLPIRSILNYIIPSQKAEMPRWAVKTNLLYGATTTLNIGGEFRLSDRLTADLYLGWNPWEGSEEKNRQIRHYMVQPELRYWITEPFNGHFIGAHLHYAHFNVSNIKLPLDIGHMIRNNRVQGDLFGLGFSYGHQWVLTKRLNIEATFGFGYFYGKYDRHGCSYCDDLISRDTKHYFGPTKAGISLIYVIK